MGIKHIIIPFKFDDEAWGAAIGRAREAVGMDTLALMLGVSEKGLWNWEHRLHNAQFPHPSMGNFIAVCNLLDLDPRAFFVLDEGAS